MHSTLSVTLLALALIDCTAAGDPDAGPGTTRDACGDPVAPQLAVCDGPPTAFRHVVEPLYHELPADGPVDATWSPADSGAIHLRIDGAAVSANVPIDPTPLNALLAEGDAVRLIASESSIRLERPDGSILLDVSTSEVFGTEPVLPLIAGFDPAMTASPACDTVEEYSTFCAPKIVRFSSIEVAGDGQPVVIAPHGSAEVTTAAGTFRVTNMVVNQALHAQPEGCAVCGIAFTATARIGVVRVH